ncbi:MAG: ribonuclease Z, partial [Armatimonadetes bacterium]|nr:ribonuclease Z [Armatimonadota bacterium]
MPATTLTFLGTDSVTPAPGDETASYLLNRTTLIDTGWNAALRLQDHGLTAVDLEYLFFTHLHHDHYLGLPGVLFWRWMKLRDQPAAKPLHIVGPAEDLELVIALACDFLQSVRFGHLPLLELHPLQPGGTFDTPRLAVSTCASIHTVQGVCYRFEDRESGAVLAFSGDTAYNTELSELAAGAHLLVHEASHGAGAMAYSNNQWGHSGSPDA